MPDQGDEYRTLREEILQGQNRREQIFNFVLTAVAAIFGFSIQFNSPYLPLVALVLLLFGMVQGYIANSMTRAADYIRLAIEPKTATLRWEMLNYEFHYQNKKQLKRRSSFTVISAILSWYYSMDIGVTAFKRRSNPYANLMCYHRNLDWNLVAAKNSRHGNPRGE